MEEDFLGDVFPQHTVCNIRTSPTSLHEELIFLVILPWNGMTLACSLSKMFQIHA